MQWSTTYGKSYAQIDRYIYLYIYSFCKLRIVWFDQTCPSQHKEHTLAADLVGLSTLGFVCFLAGPYDGMIQTLKKFSKEKLIALKHVRQPWTLEFYKVRLLKMSAKFMERSDWLIRHLCFLSWLCYKRHFSYKIVISFLVPLQMYIIYGECSLKPPSTNTHNLWFWAKNELS